MKTKEKEYILDIGIMFTKIRKAVCKCGDVFDLKTWHIPENFRCKECGNTSWVGNKSMAKGWIGETSSNRVYGIKEERKIVIEKIENKMKLKLEDNTLEKKTKKTELIIDIENKEIYYTNEGKRKKEDNSKGTGELNTDNILDCRNSSISTQEIIDLWNEYNPYWDIEYKDEYIHFRMEIRNVLKLLKLALKNPQLTLLVNERLIGLGYGSNLDIIDFMDLSKSKPHEILKLNRGVVKQIKKSEITVDDLLILQEMNNEFGVNTSIGVIKMSSNSYFINQTYGKIKRLLNNGYTINEINNYVDSVEERQVMSYRNGIIELLSDYVNMSVQMEVPYEKFPRTLKITHDLTSRNFQLVQNEFDIKNFSDIVEENRYLEGETDNYKFILPKDMNEVVREGQIQGHCVASYASLMARGDTIILFQRSKAELEKPLVTIEIQYKSINQARVRFNKSVKGQAKKELIQWAKGKGIMYRQ